MANLDKKNVRYNILTIIVYLVGIILIAQLFNLQIVHGEEYLERSNSRLTRENTIKAARGNIRDSNGNILAGTTVRFSLDIYRSKIDEETLNDTLLRTINVLEKNNDKYNNEFPIDIETMQFKYDEERTKAFLDENELDENLSANDTIDYYINEYNLQKYSKQDAIKIIAIRFGISKYGYTSMRGYEISPNVSEKSIAEIEEKNQEFPGISIDYIPIREYKYGSLLSHTLGYVGKINSDEYKNNQGYALNDYIGKTGIEYVCEKYLKGTDGLKQTDMSVDGTITAEYITQEAKQGNDVILTINSNVQQATEKSLKENIEKINAGELGESKEVNAGCAVVLNVKTGEVISLYSYPDFEPQLFVDGISSDKWNEYTSDSTRALLNRATQTAYAPGSIFKMVPSIAGLETNGIAIDEKINCAGIYPKGHNPRCWYYSTYGRGHGNLTVSEAIQKSCNCYFYEVGTRIGIENIERYATYFGLGQKTGIELPSEISGTLAGKTLYDKLGETWYYGNTLSAVIRTGGE